jgi:hypothetical protein
MNRVWTRFFRSAYRKEPISSFVFIIGLVNFVLGGIDRQGTLMAMGVSAISIAVILRWWINLRRPMQPLQASPIRYLPDRTSRQSLPWLTAKKRSEGETGS